MEKTFHGNVGVCALHSLIYDIYAASRHICKCIEGIKQGHTVFFQLSVLYFPAVQHYLLKHLSDIRKIFFVLHQLPDRF